MKQIEWEKSGPSPYRTALRKKLNQSISIDGGGGRGEQHLESEI